MRTTERIKIQKIADRIWHITVHFGFIEVPNLPLILAAAKNYACPIDLDEALYFSGRDDAVRMQSSNRLTVWRRMLFGFMYRTLSTPWIV